MKEEIPPEKITLFDIKQLRRNGEINKARKLEKKYKQYRQKCRKEDRRRVMKEVRNKCREKGICTEPSCEKFAAKGYNMCWEHIKRRRSYRKNKKWVDRSNSKEELEQTKVGGAKMQNLSKQIRELEDKATKYDNMKTRYIDYAKKLKQIKKEANKEIENVMENFNQEVDKIIGEIDPKVEVKNDNKVGKNSPMYEKVAEFVKDEILKKGQKVGIKDIQEMYPHLSYPKAYYVITKLEKDPDIHSSKKGGRKRLFINLKV